MIDYLFMLVMVLLWAGGFVTTKLSVISVHPVMVAFLRFSVASLFLIVPLAIWQPKLLRFNRSDLPLLLGLGATGVFSYNLLFYWGARFAMASDGAMIIPTLNPIMTLFVASLVLGEQLTTRKLLGVAISLVGQVLIFWSLISSAGDDTTRLLGILLHVGAAVCWSSFSILGRLGSRRFSPMTATVWGTASGTLMLAPFALLSSSPVSGFTWTFWGHVVYLGLGVTVAGIFFWNRGIARLGAGRTAIFLNLVPGTTLILAYLFLDESPTLLQVLGIIVVAVGVYMVSTARKGESSSPPPVPSTSSPTTL
jgi:drug/metabolite transporter (DMT)-like permease